MRMVTSSVDIEVIGTVFLGFFYERYSKHLKHKQTKITIQKSNIQPNISISKKESK